MTQDAEARGDPIISVRNIGLYYSRRRGFLRRHLFWALKDVSLDVYLGETVGVIGRNGVGKTTLLKILAGIIAPDRGTITNRGYRASLLSLAVGFVPYLTGRENAILSGLLLGMKRGEIESRMDHIIEFSELGDFFDQPVSTYSTGMTARLGFSVAFQIDPDILLIDEVFGVGDAAFMQKSSAAMRERIRSNKTVILVSHHAEVVKSLCDRVIWIEEGVTKAAGEPTTVLAAYQESLSLAAAEPAAVASV